MPAVVGAGRGDVEELRCAAEALRSAGWPVRSVRPPGSRWPPAAGAPDDWPGGRPSGSVRREADRAMTLTSQFGVTAAATRPGPYGRGGPWADTVAEVERVYGADRVLHVSLEEFARNLPADALEAERWREGGRTAAWIRSRRSGPGWRGEVRRMRHLQRRYRGLERPNLLVLFPTFGGSAAFRREFPEAIEIGPIYPEGGSGRDRPPRARSPPRWVWYASAASSGRLVPGIAEGVRRSGRRLVLDVRSDRNVAAGNAPRGLVVRPLPPMDRDGWDRRFRSAELRIVTGSRSLLEALVVGGPFLYFNGVTGRGGARRTHRPEKIRALLRRWRASGTDPGAIRDLSDFARARRVGSIVASALSDPRWSRRFPSGRPSTGLPPERDDGVRYLGALADRWARSELDAGSFVLEERRRARRRSKI
jgi:hypothetical protein